MAISYSILHFIGSQCSLRKRGLVWSHLNILKDKFCSVGQNLRESSSDGSPSVRELQQSSQHRMKEEMS